MPRNKVYLNYNHGSSLQQLCEEILKQIKEKKDFTNIKNIIVYEERELRKNQSEMWQCTVSSLCYHRYLKEIYCCLNNNITEKKIKDIYDRICNITRKKIYALFLIQEPACLPSIESVFRAAYESSEYETALVYTPFFHKNLQEQRDYYNEYVTEMGLPVIRCSEYDLPKHSPDVVFMIKPYGSIPEQFTMKHIKCVVPRVIYIPYGMEITTDLAKFGFQYYAHYKAWKHCAYGAVVKQYGTEYGYHNGENIVVWGHPKADHYIDVQKNRENIPQEWKEKISGRRTILWTPHHLVSMEDEGTGTWLIWGEHILDTIEKNQDVVFIFRPHPLMWGALVSGGFLSEDEVEKIQERIASMSNVIVDTYEMYYNAFDAADAIITDGTTFCIEFLYTKKPILLTPRNMEGFYRFEEMLKSYYIVNQKEDIDYFIESVRTNKDPMQEVRMQFYKDMFYFPEKGTIGQNIIENVKKDLEKECRDVFQVRVLNEEKNMQDDSMNIIENEYVMEEAEFPLFSILVLCYKNSDLLYGMLDSIFMQDYPRIELVVSDDGSADYDIEKISQYITANKRYNIEKVLVLQNATNVGTVKHIYSALQKVSGEYIVFTAADDRFACKDAISSYVESFLFEKNALWLVAQCDMVSSDYKQKKYTTPTLEDREYFESNDAQKLFSRWSRRGMAIPCCMAFRREAFNVVGGIDLDYMYLEDWPLELKLLRQGFAPFYLHKITAIHSMGGISNSNERHGLEVRKAFYKDKFRIFDKEVEPYKKLLFPEDRKAYKQYRREILDRHYFFFIDCKEKTRKQLLWYMMKKPIRFWWRFENWYMAKIKGKIPKKKLIILSQILLFCSFFFFQFSGIELWKNVFDVLGIVDMIIAGILLTVSIGSIPLEKYFVKKARLRAKLVN